MREEYYLLYYFLVLTRVSCELQPCLCGGSCGPSPQTWSGHHRNCTPTRPAGSARMTFCWFDVGKMESDISQTVVVSIAPPDYDYAKVVWCIAIIQHQHAIISWNYRKVEIMSASAATSSQAHI